MKIILIILLALSTYANAEVISCTVSDDKTIIISHSNDELLLTLSDRKTGETREILATESYAAELTVITGKNKKTIPAVLTKKGDKQAWTTHGIALESGYPIVFSIAQWRDSMPLTYYDPYLSDSSVIERGTCR